MRRRREGAIPRDRDLADGELIVEGLSRRARELDLRDVDVLQALAVVLK
jgi:hypothetical protein